MGGQHDVMNPVVERLMAAVEEEFGDRLDDAGRGRIREGLERNLTNAAALAAYGLKNGGDEPGTVFRAVSS